MNSFVHLLLWLGLAFSAPQSGTPALAPASQPQYAGSQECATCHEDLSNAFRKNTHIRLDRPVASETGHACESCHGPGKEHAESADITKIRSFKTLTPQRSASFCLDCHQKDATHSNRLFDVHTRKSVTCTSCHSVHNAAPRTNLLTKTTTDLCASCHPSARARFNRPFSHNIKADIMNCASCHAPHGGSSPVRPQLLASHANDNSCLNCHGDKRGPFTFEHMPMKFEGCAGCHEPHGSANPRMLVRSEVRQLCLECHTNSKSTFGRTPPAFHDLRSERFRNCTICHTKIHGSHTNAAFLR